MTCPVYLPDTSAMTGGAKRLSTFVQDVLWLFGLPVHNRALDECTFDFGCCIPDLYMKGFIARAKHWWACR